MQQIFDGLWKLLNLNITIMGYKFTFWNLIVYFVIMYVLLSLVFNYQSGEGK